MTGFDNVGDVIMFGAIALLPLVSASLLVLLARYSQRNPQRKRRLVLVVANVLVFVFLFSIVLLVMESYYRFWCDTTEQFGITRVSQRWLDRHFNTWTAGFRDDAPNYTLRPRPGKRRITFIGDSFTAGHGIPNVDDRFANRIRKMKPNWDILVLAVNGYDTGNEWDLAQWVISQGVAMGEVVLVYCLNDITDMDHEWQAAMNRFHSTTNPGFIWTHSFCLNTWYYRLKGWFDPDIRHYDRLVLADYNGPLWQEQKERLLAFRNLVETHGSPLRVVTFPFFDKLGPNYEYAGVHRKLDEYWREIGVPHLDLLGLYESHRNRKLTVNSHDPHPNEYAHALAADAIEKFLEENPPSSPPAETGSSANVPR